MRDARAPIYVGFHRLVCTFLVLLPVLALLSSCGGGGGSDSKPSGGGGPAPVTPEPVARIQIAPNAVVLTSALGTKQLTATAYDAKGNVVPASFTWSSSQPLSIDVSAAGNLSAKVADGAAQIVAHAGNIDSAPLLAIVTTLPVGAVPVTDAQIIGSPVETAPSAAASFDNTYSIVLSGPPPAVGALLVNTETKPVVGRVVAVVAEGSNQRVTLQMVSVRDAFPNLKLRETISFANLPVSLTPDIQAAYDVKRTGDRFEFTPKPKAGAVAAPLAAKPDLDIPAFGPFRKCEGTYGDVVLGAPIAFSIDLRPSYEIQYSPEWGLERFVARASPIVEMSSTLSIAVEVNAALECKAKVFSYPVPIGGALSLFFGGQIDVGVGFRIAAQTRLAAATIGTKLTAQTELKAGLVCPGGSDCKFEGDLGEIDVKVAPVFQIQGLEDARQNYEVGAFGYLAAQVGNPFFESLRFEAFEARVGGELAGSFATRAGQLADEDYGSNYGASIRGSINVASGITDVLKLFKLPPIDLFTLSVNAPIATSPSGLEGTEVLVDKATFTAGETLNFVVTLDPKTVGFLPIVGPYNVRQIQLVRKNGSTYDVVHTVNALPNQTIFNIPYVVTTAGAAEEFSAFLTTTLVPLDLLSLEIGVAQGQATFTRNRIATPSATAVCALNAIGNVKCWGNNFGGQLGTETPLGASATALIVAGIPRTADTIASGQSCVVTKTGGVKCWGSNAFGQLGNGTTVDSLSPVDVVGLTTGVAMVDGSGSTACAVTTAGGLKCWGWNYYGQVGDGSREDRSTPATAYGLTSGVAAVSVEHTYICVLTVASGVKCWGYGLMGSGAFPVHVTVPTDIPGLTSGVVAIETGKTHACAVTTAATIKCWGSNSAGELGNGSTSEAPQSVVDVVGLTSVRSVSVGYQSACALLLTGSVKCWGYGTTGQLGENNTLNRSTPVSVVGLNDAVAIQLGNFFACAMTTSGAMKCWGSGNYGQLGDGAFGVNRHAPYDVVNFP
jgi:alpha-tubulin suppressor-like RCC1 family protein